MHSLCALIIIYLKITLLAANDACIRNCFEVKPNYITSRERIKRETEAKNLAQMQTDIQNLYKTMDNVTAKMDKICEGKSKLQITNSYTPLEKDILTYQDRLEYERIKIALTLKNEEIARSDGRIIVLQKQIENLLTIKSAYPTNENKKDSDKACEKELLKETNSKSSKMAEQGANKYGKIIYSVNAGGIAHVDANGIYYSEDPLEGPANKQLDWCKDIKIKRAPEEDYILYQNIRYFKNVFEYKIPLPEDGPYVMVLKFCECNYKLKNQRDFNVVLNKLHIVLEHVDLYARASHGVALEEYVAFNVENGYLEYSGGKSIVNNNYTTVEFVPFNSKEIVLAAILIIKGNLENVRRLPPIYRPIF